jgi:hypothetical protein
MEAFVRVSETAVFWRRGADAWRKSGGPRRDVTSRYPHIPTFNRRKLLWCNKRGRSGCASRPSGRSVLAATSRGAVKRRRGKSARERSHVMTFGQRTLL